MWLSHLEANVADTPHVKLRDDRAAADVDHLRAGAPLSSPRLPGLCSTLPPPLSSIPSTTRVMSGLTSALTIQQCPARQGGCAVGHGRSSAPIPWIRFPYSKISALASRSALPIRAARMRAPDHRPTLWIALGSRPGFRSLAVRACLKMNIRKRLDSQPFKPSAADKMRKSCSRYVNGLACLATVQAATLPRTGTSPRRQACQQESQVRALPDRTHEGSVDRTSEYKAPSLHPEVFSASQG
jgi:hypothetical protein